MKNTIFNIITWAIVIVVLIFALNFYSKNNFNEFTKSEAILHVSQFKRDKDVKYSKASSYKIISTEANDATFFKTVKVEKNTPYKVTCMVKTDNVVPESEISGIGAQISIIGTTEKSVAVTGTQDWQKIEFIFNSKNRETVDIGFRLGGYLGKCTGTAWFSDFTLEKGTANTSNNWKFACFIFENTDVVVDGQEVKISMTDTDKTDIIDTIKRFTTNIKDLSENKMTADYDTYIVHVPITKLSYDKEFGYYVAAEDVEDSIKDIVKENEYDHIFAIIRLGNEKYRNSIEINDWIGLGSMDYYGIGYSNIRLRNSSRSYMYRYIKNRNEFPEEVFLHEFLHSLERTAQEYGYEIPALHDYEKYGYKSEALTSLKNWYVAYMNKEIKTSNGNVGLPPEVYALKPAKEADFKNSQSIDEFHEPTNIFEKIVQLFKNLVHNLQSIKQLTINNNNYDEN